MFDIEKLKFDEKGLIPAIVVDDATGDVLTLAYMNKESLAISLEKKLTCFWSRSRQELWLKGETSGNYQHIVSITADCDDDLGTLLAHLFKDFINTLLEKVCCIRALLGVGLSTLKHLNKASYRECRSNLIIYHNCIKEAGFLTCVTCGAILLYSNCKSIHIAISSDAYDMLIISACLTLEPELLS